MFPFDKTILPFFIFFIMLQFQRLGWFCLFLIVSVRQGSAEEVRPLITAGSVVMVSAASAVLVRTPSRVQESFDTGWKFFFGDVESAEKPNFDDAAWRDVDLPHDWSVEAPFDKKLAACTAFLPGGKGYYRKTFTLPEEWEGKKIAIEFDGISRNSRVWLNGVLLGQRPSGYASFSYDLTPHLQGVPLLSTENSSDSNKKNVLVVEVNRAEVGESRWYPGSGIYRHVWLTATESTRFARHGIFVTTPEVSAEKATVKIESTVENVEKATDAKYNVKIVSTLIDPSGKRVESKTDELGISLGGKKTIVQELSVEKPALWSPDSPLLYTVESKIVQVEKDGGKEVDRVTTPVGVRSIAFDADSGFLLNGVPTKIKGVCVHHDAGCLGAAVPEKVLERRLKLVKEVGGNAVRCAHNPMAREFYDLCDRLGLLVMDEAFDEWTHGKRKWIEAWNRGKPGLEGYNKYFNEWSEADLSEMVLRDRNHPSVIFWSIGNEIDYPGDPFNHPAGKYYNANGAKAEEMPPIAKKLIAVIKESDKTRPVTMALANAPVANIIGLADMLDVVGYNYQEKSYAEDHQKYPTRKIIGSENLFPLEAWKVVEDNPYVMGQFLWVGFDYLGESKGWPSRGWEDGLFDSAGIKKPAGYFRQSLWAADPMVYICVRSGARPNRTVSWQGEFSGPPVQSHWNWADPKQEKANADDAVAENAQQETPKPKEKSVEVYSNCAEVELFLNGRSLGVKKLAEQADRVFHWKVPFEPGELKAVGRAAHGKQVEYSLKTAGKPVQLAIVSDRHRLNADGNDTAHLEIRAIDEEGNLVPQSDIECHVEVKGAGRLIGLDNGNPRDVSPFNETKEKLYLGRCMAFIQAARELGGIEIVASAPDLKSVTLRIPAAGK